MQLFGSKNNLSYLGVDLGNAGVKIVELKNEGGKPALVTYGLAEMSIDAAGRSVDQTEEEIVELLKQICAKSKVSTNKAISSLPSFSVFSSIITLPEMKDKELSKAIIWEAKKFLPMNVEDMNLDWRVIGKYESATGLNDIIPQKQENFEEKKEEATKNISENIQEETKKQEIKNEVSSAVSANHKSYLKILVTAAPKKNVARYLSIFKKAGIELLGLETESFALERSLIGYEESPIMIVDIGAITSDLIIVEKGIPVLSRSVDAGGATITQMVASGLKVDIKRAEQFKRDIGFQTNTKQGIPKVIENSIEPIINEIKYCFDLFLSREEKNKRIEKIVLTGGSSFLPNLPEFLSELLNIKVVIGDPWSRIVYPMELKPVLDELAPRMSVAVGLAMREIE
jgi:type IV pilus assembly protein PilM